MTDSELPLLEELIVYRVDSGTEDDLSNRNAGNVAAAISHFRTCDDRLMGCGNHLSAYVVKVYGNYGEYVAFTGGKQRTGKGLVQLPKEVGITSTNQLVSYSFMQGGHWQAKKVGSIPLSEIPTLEELDLTSDADVRTIELLFECSI